MCRFLMVRSAAPLAPAGLLEDFAVMAEASRAPDGDRQADGWGAAWPDGGGGWHSYKSTAPVWEDRSAFGAIPPASLFIVHARSASFPSQKGILAYNQPFVSGPFAFVFNGMLLGVSLPLRAPGDIGAQKIWALLSLRLTASAVPGEALAATAEFLERHTRSLQGLNLGLSDGVRAYALCRYESGGAYYQMYRHDSPGFGLISSEPLRSFDFVPVPKDEVIVA